MENELLIISPNHKNRIGLSTGFAVLGFAVADASDIAQAEQSIRNDGMPHLIIVDVHGVDRDRLLEFAHTHKNLRFIALGDTSLDYAVAQKIGAEEILPTPHHLYDMREYVQHIATHLR